MLTIFLILMLNVVASLAENNLEQRSPARDRYRRLQGGGGGGGGGGAGLYKGGSGYVNHDSFHYGGFDMGGGGGGGGDDDDAPHYVFIFILIFDYGWIFILLCLFIGTILCKHTGIRPIQSEESARRKIMEERNANRSWVKKPYNMNVGIAGCSAINQSAIDDGSRYQTRLHFPSGNWWGITPSMAVVIPSLTLAYPTLAVLKQPLLLANYLGRVSMELVGIT